MRSSANLKSLPGNQRVLIYLWIALPSIIIFSCLPGFHPDQYIYTHYHIPGDLWVHVGSYFFIGFLGFLLLSFNKHWVFMSFVLLFIFSFLLELVQILIPGRGFSWLDILFNFIGVALCVLFAGVYYRLSAKKRKNSAKGIKEKRAK